MSSLNLIRQPAWEGLEPGLPALVPADDQTSQLLLEEIGIHGSVAELRTNAGPAVIFCILQDGVPSVFLKLTDSSRIPSVLRAESIASWLLQRGAPVAAPCRGYPRQLADGRLLTVQPYLAGRRLQATEADMQALGAAVGDLHRQLAAHPDQQVWEVATRGRLALLAGVREAIASGELRGAGASTIAELCAETRLDMCPSGLPVRPLHGDLNPGNILIVADKVIFMDFEDVYHSVLPVCFELFLLLERLVLIREPDDHKAYMLGTALFRAYRRENFDVVIPANANPADILRTLALRSLCTLMAGAAVGKEVSVSEWNKFLYLEQQARERNDVIRRIFEDSCR